MANATIPTGVKMEKKYSESRPRKQQLNVQIKLTLSLPLAAILQSVCGRSVKSVLKRASISMVSGTAKGKRPGIGGGLRLVALSLSNHCRLRRLFRAFLRRGEGVIGSEKEKAIERDIAGKPLVSPQIGGAWWLAGNALKQRRIYSYQLAHGPAPPMLTKHANDNRPAPDFVFLHCWDESPEEK